MIAAQKNQPSLLATWWSIMTNNTHRRSSEFVIDKRLLAINFDVLAWLQSTLFLPKLVNVSAIRQHFGIRMEPAEMLTEIRDNPNSPLRRYFVTMMRYQIDNCLLLEDAAFQAMLLNLEETEYKKELIEFYDDIREEKTHREKLEAINALLIKNGPIFKFDEVHDLKHFILNNLRVELLQHYAQYIKDSETTDFVHRAIVRIGDRIERNLHKIDRLKEEATTETQRKAAYEMEERYARHLFLISPENIEKNLSHLQLQDPVTLKQHLLGVERNEELAGKEIKQEAHSYSKVTASMHINDIPTSSAQGSPKPITEQQQLKSKYRDFQHKLNDAFSHTIDEAQIVVAGIDEFLELQHKLHKLLYSHETTEGDVADLNNTILHYLEKTKFDATTGADFYLRPVTTDKDNGYFFDEQHNNLTYCAQGKNYKISIKNGEVFKRQLLNLMAGDSARHLTNEEIDTIIPWNQGHLRLTHAEKLINFLAHWCKTNGLFDAPMKELPQDLESLNQQDEKEPEKPEISEPATLQNGSELLSQSDLENIQDIEQNIQALLENETTSEQEKQTLQDIIELINHELKNGKKEEFADAFDRIIQQSSDLPLVTEISDKIINLDIFKGVLDPKTSISPN